MFFKEEDSILCPLWEVHAIGKENCLPSNHKALNMSNSTCEKYLPPLIHNNFAKIGLFQKFWMTNQNQSDSCESHADFDYKHLKSLTYKLIKDAAHINHCPLLHHFLQFN
jgi:hypothetical protein